jgi:hypothetical protein
MIGPVRRVMLRVVGNAGPSGRGEGDDWNGVKSACDATDTRFSTRLFLVYMRPDSPAIPIG